MRFYSLTDTHILQMPIRRFWLLEANIARIRAEEQLLELRTSQAAQAGNKEIVEQLTKEMGTVVVLPAKRDKDATATLKSLASLGK